MFKWLSPVSPHRWLSCSNHGSERRGEAVLPLPPHLPQRAAGVPAPERPLHPGQPAGLWLRLWGGCGDRSANCHQDGPGRRIKDICYIHRVFSVLRLTEKLTFFSFIIFQVRKILELVQCKGEEACEYFIYIIYKVCDAYVDLQPWLKDIKFNPSSEVALLDVVNTDPSKCFNHSHCSFCIAFLPTPYIYQWV